MRYEEALELAGSSGRFQWLMLFLVFLYATTVAFNNMSIVFLGAKPEHWCYVPGAAHLNLTIEQLKGLTVPKEERDGELVFSNCMMYSCTNWTDALQRQVPGNTSLAYACGTTTCQHGWMYDQSVYESTIVTEWDLVCDRRPLEAMSQSVYMAGLMVGVLGSGIIADWLGRKTSMIMGVLLMTSFALSVPFCKTFLTFVILRFVVAAGSIAAATSSYVIAVELVGPGPRTWAGTLGTYFWTLGNLCIAGLAYALRDWRDFALSFAVPLLLLFIPFIILPESARWLYSKNKVDRGEAILRTVAKWNKRSLPDKLDVVLDSRKQEAYPWEFFRYPRMRIRTMIIYLNWCVVSMVYYGLSLNTSDLAGNDHLNFFISSAIEFPAYFFCHLTLDRYGRRFVLSSSMILGGLALIMTLAVPHHQQFQVATTVLAMLGKWSMSVAFTAIYLFTTELFPTTMRNIGLGSSSFWARVGGIVAPQVALLRSYNKIVPPIVFGSLAVIAGMAAIALPETAHSELPETILEAENFGRSSSANKVNLMCDDEVVFTVSRVEGGGSVMINKDTFTTYM